MNPTRQQQAVIDRMVGKGEILIVNAYAGSGKTATLNFVTRARPEARFLYLCFNHDNAAQAQHRFPANCECRTAHSLAWRAVGHQHGKPSQLRARTVMEQFDISEPHRAVYCIKTLNAFLYSADPALSPAHLQIAPGTSSPDRKDILRVAGKIWERMRDPDDKSLPISHDGYLKLWALGYPEITDYDVLLLDEAQDTNPVTLKIVLDQVKRRSAGLILVGDTHQAIYAWRGAVNAMESVRELASEPLPLTESFRFVPGIAADASILLNQLKGDSVNLIGSGSPKRRASDYAVLARANASLIEAAFEKAKAGMPIHFAATKRDKSWDPFVPYKFQITLDTWNLWRERPGEVRDPYMRKFRSFAEIEEHARGEGEQRHGRDVELDLQTRLVKEFGDEIPRLLKLLQQRSVAPEDARLSFSTAHRAKGLEWDYVRLLDDFLDPADSEFHQNLEPAVYAEEVNILYVAITRARLKVMYPPKLLHWFHLQAPGSRGASHRYTPGPAISGHTRGSFQHTPISNGVFAPGSPPRRKRPADKQPRPRERARRKPATPTAELLEISRRISGIPISRRTENLPANQRSVRDQYPRAYEPWTDREDKWLANVWPHGLDLAKLAAAFQRDPLGIANRAEKLGLG